MPSLAVADTYSNDCLPDYLQAYKVLGKATDSKGTPLYEETLTFTKENGGQLEVSYATPQKMPLATKKVDFECRIASPNFTLFNHQQELLISVVREQNTLLSLSDLKQEQHELPDQEFIVDAGFDNYVKQNWQTLLAGKTIKVNFFFPNRQTFFRLEVEKTKPPRVLKALVRNNPEGIIFFKISANNFFFKMFSSPLYIGYRPDRSLRYFLGASNLPMIDESPVLISYQSIE